DAARFVMQRGFVLGQVGRESRLDMPSDLTDLRRHRDEALVKAGADYRLHFWDTEVPEQFHEGCAALLTAQSTEMPHGEIDRFESVWDAARYREQLETIAKGGERFMVLAAEHVPTGELVAYNEIGVAASGVSGWQGDMIVLPAHRGHRLGLLTLAEGLLRMAELCPTVERVYTWNAEENVPALAISVACGFRPAGVEAEWQRKR
ncbi:MAG: GNAT family N-acetyltransferase, partial [Promicromonosporaceae bacterium]|nr:GNAT family N-acetyltransferase [Promicromonosporaceae bacterium]